MSEKRFVQCEIEYGFANTTNIKKIDGIFDMQEEKTYRIEQIVDVLNEQQATIEQLRQSQDVKEFSALFNQSIALQREIKDLKEENEQLLKEKDYWKKQAMTLLMQVRRLTPRMTDKEVIEFGKELEDE